MQKLLINEIFKSIQGEGKYVGYPALFIRLSGCNRKCEFCDTKHHEEINYIYTPEELANLIEDSFVDLVVWTGGEPMLQADLMREVVLKVRTFGVDNHLETNGYYKNVEQALKTYLSFDYISFSPKDKETAQKLWEEILPYLDGKVEYDVKIVFDGDKEKGIGSDLLEFATMLMPLTTGDKRKDKKIARKVWEYCVETGVKYSPRIHMDVWEGKKGV